MNQVTGPFSAQRSKHSAVLMETDEARNALGVLLACSSHETAGAQIGYTPSLWEWQYDLVPLYVPTTPVALHSPIFCFWLSGRGPPALS